MNLETKSNENERTEQSRIRRRVAIIAGGGAILVALGVAVGSFLQRTPSEKPAPSTHDVSTTRLPSPTHSFVASPEQAKLHILERDYQGALRIYEMLPVGEMTDELRYKQAVCLEMLKQWEPARNIYQRLVESAVNHQQRLASLTGVIRTRVGSRQFREAKTESFRTLLQTDDDDAAELWHLLSYSACNSAYQRNENLLTDGIRIPFQMPEPNIAFELWQIADEQVVAHDANNPISPKVEVLDRLSSDPQDIHVNLSAIDETLMTILHVVAKSVGLNINWTPSAMSALEGHKATVSIQDIDVATLLDALLEPSRLCWEPIPRGVGVKLQREVPRQKLAALQRTQAKRIASKTVMLHPDHILQEQTYMCLGNMAFWDGSYGEAASYFEEISDTFNQRSVVKTAWFNLAKVHWIAQERQACREALLRVVDQTEGAAIESIAYYFLGLLELGNHRPMDAAKLLGRARSLSKDQEVQTESAIYMSVAQLMANNPQAANRVLTDNRNLIRAETWKAEAVFLNTFSRFSAAVSTEQQIDEGRDLVAALAYVDPAKFDGAIGYYLVGRAFEQLGFVSRAEQVFAQGATIRNDELSHLIKMRMAQIARDDQRLADARKHLDSLAQVESTDWARHAKLEYARLDFDAKRYASCINRAVQLLPNSSPTEKVQVLELIGRAFEKQNNHYQAALCFAGMIPTEGISLQTGEQLMTTDRLRR